MVQEGFVFCQDRASYALQREKMAAAPLLENGRIE